MLALQGKHVMRVVTSKLYLTPICHLPLPHAHLEGWAWHAGASLNALPLAGDRKEAAAPLHWMRFDNDQGPFDQQRAARSWGHRPRLW